MIIDLDEKRELSKMFVYLYTRVSNKNSQADDSAHQVNSSMAHIAQLSFVLVKSYHDKGSGSITRSLPGMQQMWEDISADSRSNKIIFVYEVSRFSRTWENALPLFELCRKNSLNIYSVSQSLSWIHNVPSANAGFENALTLSQQEYYHICERNRAAAQVRKEKGIKIGAAPYGYMRDPQDKTRFIPNPEEMAQIKRLQDLYVSGKDCYDSAQVLRDADVCIRGLYWTDNSVRMVLKRTGAFNRPFGKNPASYPHPETISYEEAMRPEGPRITAAASSSSASVPVFSFGSMSLNSEKDSSVPEANVGSIEYEEELIYLPDWIIRNKLNSLASQKGYALVWFDRLEKNIIHYINRVLSDADKRLVGEVYINQMLITGRRE